MNLSLLANLLSSLGAYFLEKQEEIFAQLATHLWLTLASLFLAVLISVPLGIWISRKEKLASLVLGFTNVLQTIPSIALLGFMIPLMGIGIAPAITALFLYALLPIVRNTYTGITEVDDSITEAAKGMGMSSWQILGRVELPLALPVIFAGIRTATVINVGVATLAAYIGAGGLGEFIFGGIALNDSQMILAGAIPAALLAVLLDTFLGRIQLLPIRTLSYLVTTVMIIIPVGFGIQFFSEPKDQKFTAAFDPEFFGRLDGYPTLQETYGMDVNAKSMNTNLMYEAVFDGRVDLISGYSTDGRIKTYDLAVLADDKAAFPPYDAAPIVHRGVYERFPEVIPVLNLLAGRISDSTMIQLNYQADHMKREPDSIANAFLVDLKLVDENGNAIPEIAAQLGGGLSTSNEPFIIGSKNFTEQFILIAIFKQLIETYTLRTVDLKAGLGGTKICFEALKAEEIDMYPAYTGTGFGVMLGGDKALKDSLGGTSQDILKYVDDQFNAQFNIDWLEPLGFNNTYAIMMKKELAEEYKLKTLSDFVRVRKK
ncbi:MAG: ABC transporter permease/substrate-binding protein [Bacteroidota bacterium]